MKIARCSFMFAIVLALVMAVAGCASTPTPVPPTAQPTVVPPTLTPTFESTLRVVVDKDFKNSAESWCTSGSYSYGEFYCREGEFHAIAKGVGNIATPGSSTFVDFVVETQMRIIDDSGAYGVAFRGHSTPTPAGFYIFRLRPSGQYQLIVWSQDPSQSAVLIQWTDSPAIKKGPSANLVKVVAQGNQITLFANGEKLASINDTNFSQGAVAPVASEQGHIVVSSFKMWRPLP